MHFDLADLRLFLHLAECKNLTRGANAAALSPAAASSRLKALENQLNARLFYRDSRGLALTHAGEMLQRHARAILRQVEHVRNDFLALSSDSVGHFRIFANTTPITETLPSVLAAFMKDRPNVTVDIQERNTREVVRGVIDSAADIGVLSVPGPFHAGDLQSRLFTTDRLVLAAPEGHPLSERDTVSFEECLNMPHVGFRESTLQSYVLEQASLLNRKLSMRVLMSSYETMCSMIAAGVGVGVMPESCARRYIRAGMPLKVVQLSDSWSLRERHIIYRDLDALPLCARAFVDALMAMQAPAEREHA
ncbi:LysR substrate-binding domain-containing protein [Ramlibacter tataouinensis]|uniref:LysR substrate-binding domain-containing protein n=1 Tax=Ramlibacter tataouinensis TaxID=94132 RepID=UPI0022F3CF86|nr:LysR substrate-binding domain-containing protein [Ramlibacter tataouinensis]WBY01068.1 LysR substrate-binding domain-containing protein [Ramlibacter tataouinensis]